MPKILLDRCAPDSVREFRLAARRRFEDGVELADAEHRLSAIYVFGYAAEMILKAGYFSVVGFGDLQVITMADLRAAAAKAAPFGLVWPGAPHTPNLHHVASWARLLVAERATMPGKAYAAAFAAEVEEAGSNVQKHWKETLRYKKNQAYFHELASVRSSAWWLLDHSSAL
jgi:hypothetical protein